MNGLAGIAESTTNKQRSIGLVAQNWIDIHIKWAAAWDFLQCGVCDQQSLRSACAYAQSD